MVEKKEVHIAACIMMKNEQKRLHVTLDSIRNIVSSLVIFDTGSTDTTLEIVENFAQKYEIPVRLKRGEFVDFATSRNVLLEFADTFEDIDYLLLLDVNDEICAGEELYNYLCNSKDIDCSAFLLLQKWFSGNMQVYFNVRLIKPRYGWRYKGVVHEYIQCTDPEEDKKERLRIELPNLVLFQDRTKDDDKSGKRFHRDKVLLYEEHKKNPNDARTTFYLAQTYSCLEEFESAYNYYKKRTKQEGFQEEVYESYLCLGNIAQNLGKEWIESFDWYMRAYLLIPRVEPLLAICTYYHQKDNVPLMYIYASLACKLAFPEHCILFIDHLAYSYKRWHLLAISSFYLGAIQEGMNACLTAIENGRKNNINVELDISNLRFYTEFIKNNPLFTKEKFIQNEIRKYKACETFPDACEEELIEKAKNEYCEYYKKYLLK